MAADWLLLDGSSLMFRAFFGIPVGAFKAPDGQPVNAVRGFLDMLARLVTDRKPKALVVATDEDWRPAFRVKVIASYKTARLERGAAGRPVGRTPGCSGRGREDGGTAGASLQGSRRHHRQRQARRCGQRIHSASASGRSPGQHRARPHAERDAACITDGSASARKTG